MTNMRCVQMRFALLYRNALNSFEKAPLRIADVMEEVPFVGILTKAICSD